MKCKLTRKLTEDELIVALAVGARDTKNFVFTMPANLRHYQSSSRGVITREADMTFTSWKTQGYEAWLFEEVEEDG